ncbi:MAG TPA: hypothetical protein VII63_12845 [Caulobacteraceae bacterium]
MNEVARLSLLLLLASGALTAAAGPALWWMRADRRVRRAVRRAVGAKPDAELITGNGGAGFSLETGAIGIVWDKGRWRMTYTLDELMGAEILIDDVVAARAFRGEQRRPLEVISGQARNVCLRLLFDDPRRPDFELELWPSASPGAKHPASPAAAIRAANSWLARTETLVRRGFAAAPVIRADTPRPRPRPNEDPDFDEEAPDED